VSSSSAPQPKGEQGGHDAHLDAQPSPQHAQPGPEHAQPGPQHAQLKPIALLPGLDTKFSTLAIALIIVFYPVLADNDFWTTVLVSTGVFAAAAIGLNLLTGYTGQVSLGHAAFLTVGSYVAAYFGATQGLWMIVWLPLAGVFGAAVGAIIGPFALRVKGDYLVVISLALLFFTAHVVRNWESVTGGNDGISTSGADLGLGPLNFADLRIFGHTFTREEGLFYLAWIMVGVFALIARNVVRSRPGRAMQAVRDRDTAAEVLGVSSAQYKIAAFVLSSAMASAAGAVLAVHQRFLTPTEPLLELFVSIQFVAIIVVGGVATVYGAIIGAFLLTVLPETIKTYTHWFDFNIPIWDKKLVSSSGIEPGLFNPGSFSNFLFGLLLVVFLLLSPQGIAGWIRAVKGGAIQSFWHNLRGHLRGRWFQRGEPAASRSRA